MRIAWICLGALMVSACAAEDEPPPPPPPATCEPATCPATACGTVDDGCGGSLECGVCPEEPACRPLLTLADRARGTALEGYKEIEGDVDVDERVDVTKLGCLERVGGDLSIRNTKDLTGLGALEVVGGSLTIADNRELEAIGLGALRVVEHDLWIRRNPRLTTIDGLGALERVRELDIRENPLLRRIDGLTGLTRTGGDLVLLDLPVLVDASGLSHLQEIGGTWILVQNTGIASLDFLGGLTAFHGGTLADNHGVVKLVGNPRMASLEGLAPFSRLGGLVIERNLALTRLAGVEGLGTVDFLQVHSNEWLGSLAGLEHLVTVGGEERTWEPVLSVAANPRLRNIEALAALRRVGDLWINDNPLLTSIQPLMGVTNFEGLYVEVFQNAKLLQCGAVDVARHLLDVATNPNLPTVDVHHNAPCP